MFQNVIINDNWGSLEYFIGTERLKKDSRIEVQWPDKTITKHQLIAKNYSYCCDGNYITIEKFFIVIYLHELEIEVPIEKIKIRKDIEQSIS